MGGFSSEYEVSIGSGNLVYDKLNRELFDPFRVIISKEGWYVLDDKGNQHSINRADFSFTMNGEVQKFDAVFNAIHGAPGEDGPLAAYFSLIDLPQTASDHFASALTFSKVECSMIVKSFGVTIPHAAYLQRGESYDIDALISEVGLPCFVKPSRSGSSIGVSKVSDSAEMQDAIEKAFDIDHQVVVETMISGTETACGVSNHSGAIEALAVTDVIPKNDFFDYESKYSGLSEEFTPARIDAEVYQRIMKESEYIYAKLGLNGLARVDYIVSDNVAYFIEVNTVPGFSKESILPKQVAYRQEQIGTIFDRCLLQILN